MYQAEIQKFIPCKVIYSKEYEHGTLFALILSRQRTVGSIDKQIIFLEQSLQLRCESDKFTSISAVLSGKFKSFGVGEHKLDKHYRAVFSTNGHAGRRETTVHSDVKAWYPEVGDASLTGDESES